MLLLLGSTGAFAQATRTWVSGVGDDVNPCSRTAPCKTFAGAISKTAAKGVISVLDPGGFGTVTITKAITIDGGGIHGSILASATTGVVVNAGVNDVVKLTNISIDGSGTGLNGVRFLAGAALIIDNVKIHDFSGAGGNGVLFIPGGTSRLVVVDSLITNNINGGGILVQPGASGAARVSLSNVTLSNNKFGLRADDRSDVSVRDSLVTNNAGVGLLALSGSQASEMSIDSSQITLNGIGNASAAGVKSEGGLASVVISQNLITGNQNGLLSASGGDLLSFGSNRVTGNTVDGNPTGTLTTR
ncbi:right-handed parallel beta-helix repeat-containing protein [Luteimonas aquatica]|uniref:right-handed parallel beta-helix repeat-containing protein n=1 Tax=Luteimonas aquatica TaxID=450364 RepID=UPI001F55D58B|nr:right-handed parallel beta-helix repeat-containing protein [Luteimonas aquatica]